MKILATLTCLFFWLPPWVQAEEDVIEALENRLYQDSQDAFELADPLRPTVEVSESQRYQDTSRIQGQMSGPKEAQQIAHELKKIEQEIDRVASQVEKTKNALLQRADAENYLKVDLVLAKAKGYAIDNIALKIDGFAVHRSNKDTSFWETNQAMPIFFGPITVGNHAIDVEARFAKLVGDDVQLTADMLKQVSKRLDLHIDPAKKDAHYTIRLDAQQQTIEMSGGLTE